MSEPHRYFSTACRHALCDKCRLQCKYCGASCDCLCHDPQLHALWLQQRNKDDSQQPEKHPQGEQSDTA